MWLRLNLKNFWILLRRNNDHASHPIWVHLAATMEYNLHVGSFIYTNRSATMGWLSCMGSNLVFSWDYLSLVLFMHRLFNGYHLMLIKKEGMYFLLWIVTSLEMYLAFLIAIFNKGLLWQFYSHILCVSLPLVCLFVMWLGVRFGLAHAPPLLTKVFDHSYIMCKPSSCVFVRLVIGKRFGLAHAPPLFTKAFEHSYLVCTFVLWFGFLPVQNPGGFATLFALTSGILET